MADAIVVLSGSSTYIERADWAARQYRAGRAPVVILTDDKLISGWNKAEERNPYFYELAARELQKPWRSQRAHTGNFRSSTGNL